jgi:hypothetical protein
VRRGSLALCWAALALAPALRGAILYEQHGRSQVCKDPASEFSRNFEVKNEGQAEVEISGIKGVTKEHQGEARVWLDDLLLGPLRQEHGDVWVSPLRPVLNPGKHRIWIECGDEPFEFRDLVVGRGLGEPKPGAATADHQAAGALTHIEPTPSPLPQTVEGPCGIMQINRQWPGNPGHAILLSEVDPKRELGTGLLATLKRGEQLEWWFKVDSQDVPPLQLSEIEDPKLWALRFSLDEKELAKEKAGKNNGKSVPRGYTPGQWNSLRLSFCSDGMFLVQLSGGEVSAKRRTDELQLPLEIRAKGIEFRIKGVQAGN